MRTVPPIALSILILATSVGATAVASPDIEAEIAAIQNEFGVQIHCEYNRDLFIPPLWRSAQVVAEGKQMETEEVDRLLPLIRGFLSAHPISVIHSDLEHIYLLGEFICNGKMYGSTYVDKSIYLVSKGVEHRYTEEFITQRLHSEFSSILLLHHTFPSAQWQQINGEAFCYGGTGFELLDNPTRYDCTEQSCSEGFLLTYSKSSMENDFNMISSWLFTKKPELDVVSLKHNKIRLKQRLAEQFYTSLSDQYRFD